MENTIELTVHKKSLGKKFFGSYGYTILCGLLAGVSMSYDNQGFLLIFSIVGIFIGIYHEWQANDTLLKKIIGIFIAFFISIIIIGSLVKFVPQLLSKVNPQVKVMNNFNIGRKEFINKNYPKALEYLTKSSKNGSIRAKNLLAGMYMQGNGIEKDYEKASKLLYYGASKGDKISQFTLATLYYDGIGVEQNFDKAVKLLKKSEKQGFWKSKWLLGIMYYEGTGLEQNTQKAYELLDFASKKGMKPAQESLNLLCQDNPNICKK